MVKCPDANLHLRAKSKILRVLPTVPSYHFFQQKSTGRAWFLGEVRYQYGVGGAKSLGVPSVFELDVRRRDVYLSGSMLTFISK